MSRSTSAIAVAAASLLAVAAAAAVVRGPGDAPQAPTAQDQVETEAETPVDTEAETGDPVDPTDAATIEEPTSPPEDSPSPTVDATADADTDDQPGLDDASETAVDEDSTIAMSGPSDVDDLPETGGGPVAALGGMLAVGAGLVGRQRHGR